MNLFRVFGKSMQDALAACFRQQVLVGKSIVVGENTNNGRKRSKNCLYYSFKPYAL